MREVDLPPTYLPPAYLRDVELKRVVRREGHAQPSLEKVGKRVARIRHEEACIRDRRDRAADLRDVVEILEHRTLLQVDTVRDARGEEERGREVVDWTRLARMRPQLKAVEASRLAQPIQRTQVGPEVEMVIRIRRVGVVGVGLCGR